MSNPTKCPHCGAEESLTCWFACGTDMTRRGAVCYVREIASLRQQLAEEKATVERLSAMWADRYPDARALELHHENNALRRELAEEAKREEAEKLIGHQRSQIAEWSKLSGKLLARLEAAEAERDWLQESMKRVAAIFGITHPLQLVGRAEDNKETYTDILVKIGTEQIAILRAEVERLKEEEKVIQDSWSIHAHHFEQENITLTNLLKRAQHWLESHRLAFDATEATDNLIAVITATITPKQ